MRPLAALLVIALSISLMGIAGRAASPPDPSGIGPYAIGHTSILLIDPDRDRGSPHAGRPVFVSVFYPVDPTDITAASAGAVYPLDPVNGRWPVSTSAEWERYGIDRAYEGVGVSDDGPFPLVMFSPGWTNPYYFGLFTATRLASHGSVVATLTHYADGWFPWEPWNEIHVALVDRPRDMSFALSAVLAKAATPGDLLSGAVRDDQIAAAGHSLGGYAALVLAGGDDLVCDRARDPRGIPIPPETCVATRPDPRVKAVVTFDGSSQILWFRELGRITTPAMLIGQEWENVGAWHARAHAAISAEPNYRVDVNNSMHPSFTTFCDTARVLGDKGLWTARQVAAALGRPWCTSAIPASEAQRLATQYTIAFLKTHLAGHPGYQQILTPGWALTVERDIEFLVTERTNARATDENLPCMVPTCPTFGYFPNQPGSSREQAERDPEEIPGSELGQ